MKERSLECVEVSAGGIVTAYVFGTGKEWNVYICRAAWDLVWYGDCESKEEALRVAAQHTPDTEADIRKFKSKRRRENRTFGMAH